jgi:UMF1 family MFS transporter
MDIPRLTGLWRAKSFLSRERRDILSWALYDWANSAFATIVIAGFFPVFFKEYWSGSADVTQTTLRLGAANSLGCIAAAALAPFLGAIADRRGARKRFLMSFCVLGVVSTSGLYWVAKGNWEVAAGLYVLAIIGFMGGNSLYDSLIVSVARRERLDAVSALGFALGYLGGGLLLAFCVLLTLKHELFGMAEMTQAVRLSFLLVALWWSVFALPLFIFVREDSPSKEERISAIVAGGVRQLISTLQKIKKFRKVLLFLLSYWLYIDAVDTIVSMAVDYGLSLGFSSSDLILALLVTQFVGFPAAMAFGKIGERIGAKRGILIGISVYILVTLWGYAMKHAWEFFAMAVAVGLVQGGVQSLSRSLYARLIPVDHAAEFFGFYNMLGKFAAVIGPIMVGWVAYFSSNPRYGILSLIILFVAGGALLTSVDAHAEPAAS